MKTHAMDYGMILQSMASSKRQCTDDRDDALRCRIDAPHTCHSEEE